MSATSAFLLKMDTSVSETLILCLVAMGTSEFHSRIQHLGAVAISRAFSVGLVSVPGGHFLNWRHGWRRTVPKELTLLRWRSILNDAVARDGVALLWLHPENLIDGPGTFELLDQIVRMAADLRDSKGLSGHNSG